MASNHPVSVLDRAIRDGHWRREPASTRNWTESRDSVGMVTDGCVAGYRTGIQKARWSRSCHHRGGPVLLFNAVGSGQRTRGHLVCELRRQVLGEVDRSQQVQ